MMSRLPAQGGQVITVAANLEEHRDPRLPAPLRGGRVELRVGAQRVARDIPGTSATMASTEPVIASWSASGLIAQNTVSRMIIGGSTGFRMMTALPRAAPRSTRWPAPWSR